MNAFISVIIPVYNAEKYLEESVNSIISSSVFSELEVLLIDDGSKDGSGQICDKFSQKYENIRTFHTENGGVSNARNIGIAEACGEYVTFCDADDYYINDILCKALLALKENRADLLFYDFVNEQQNNSVARLPFQQSKMLSKSEIKEIFKYMLKNEGFNSVWNKFFKKPMISNNGITFASGQKYGEDRDFVLKFLSVCKTVFYIPETGYFYRYVKTGAVNKKRTDYFDNIHNEVEFKLDISKEFDIPFSEAEQMIKESAVFRIVSSAFSAAENGMRAFVGSLRTLYKNDKLLAILREYKNIKFHNSAYEKVAYYLTNKKTSACWFYISFLKLKEYIYKLIHHKG